MKKILVIDDAEYILESTSTLLSFEGFDVITATNGLEGVQKALNELPDLIVCDISMPEMDGYQVLEKVREDIKIKTIPFIFLTAFTDKSNLRAGMERGADDYLFKPFTRDELISAIEAQFKKSNIIEEKFQQKVDEISRNITYSLPHEFRTVLNQITGSARFINQNYKSINQEDLKELSSDILDSAQRLNKITENYLIFAGIEVFITNPAKRKQLRKFLTDEPGIIIIDIAQTLANDYSRNDDLKIESTVSDIKVELSSDSFFKIMSEILDNAFKFSKAGDIIKINMTHDNNEFTLTIEDSGRGMTDEQIQNIGAYQQFERQVYEQQGLGLGLALAKKLTELHDGKLELKSEIDTGTIVKITLPIH